MVRGRVVASFCGDILFSQQPLWITLSFACRISWHICQKRLAVCMCFISGLPILFHSCVFSCQYYAVLVIVTAITYLTFYDNYSHIIIMQIDGLCGDISIPAYNTFGPFPCFLLPYFASDHFIFPHEPFLL